MAYEPSVRRIATALMAAAAGCTAFGVQSEERPPPPVLPADASVDVEADVAVNVGEDSDGGKVERVAHGLVALYSFDENGGALVHDEVADQALHVRIETPSTVKWGPGFLETTGNALIASESAATKIHARLTASSALTIEAWIKPKTTTDQGPARIVDLGRGAGARNFMVGQQGTSIHVRLRTLGNDGYNAFLGDGGVDPLSFVDLRHEVGPSIVGLHHIVFTRDRGGLRVLWIDNVPAPKEPLPNDFSEWDPTMKLSFASENPEPNGTPTTRYWHGELHLVAIYDRALSAEEIAVNFAAGPDP